jgi:septum formation inhibitor MinC
VLTGTVLSNVNADRAGKTIAADQAGISYKAEKRRKPKKPAKKNSNEKSAEAHHSASADFFTCHIRSGDSIILRSKPV